MYILSDKETDEIRNRVKYFGTAFLKFDYDPVKGLTVKIIENEDVYLRSRKC